MVRASGLAATMLAVGLVMPGPGAAASDVDVPFQDGLFRRCVAWLIRGDGGALIDNLCEDRYALPTPSMFICARKAISGFDSATDREVCAVLFEEQARKTRATEIR